MIQFSKVYSGLLAAHGPQRWWPADEPFEIMAGALLVQRTTWQSAATALDRLKQKGLLRPQRLRRARLGLVEQCIKGAGFFQTKAVRLKKLARFVDECGGIEGLGASETTALRELLLGLEGVGPETADAILLYAFARPAVVVDAYLRRLSQRLTAAAKAPADSRLRTWVAGVISDAEHLNEFHALVVAHGKAVCRPVPRCPECRISRLCRTGRAASSEI